MGELIGASVPIVFLIYCAIKAYCDADDYHNS